MSILFFVIAILVFIAPLAYFLGQVSFSAVSEIFHSGKLAVIFYHTLMPSLWGAIGSIVIAMWLARQFAFYQWRGKRLQRLMVLIPYLVPNFVLASCYVYAWNPGSGLLNPFLKLPIYSFFGLSMLYAVAHYPISFLIFEERLKMIDPSLREAAQISGANSWQSFWQIDFALLKPSLLVTFCLSFSLNLSAFAIPSWLGAPAKIYPLTYKIYQALQLGGPESLQMASGYSLLLLLITLPVIVLLQYNRRSEKKYVTVAGKSARLQDQTQSKIKFIAFQIIFFCSQSIFWLLPLCVMFLITVTQAGCLQESGMVCLKELTFKNYHYVLFELAETKSAIISSLLYGSLSVIIILLLSGLYLLIGYHKAWVKRWVDTIFNVPISAPGAVLALSLIVFYSGKFKINLYNTPWIVVMAFVLKHMNLAFQPLQTAASGISNSLLEASLLSGASTRKSFFKIILPILTPDFLGAAFLILIPILGELTMSIFLTSPSFRSIGTVMFDLQDYADPTAAAALAIILVLMILCLNEMARFLSRGKLGY